MKRAGYLYAEICSMENLELAHQNARKGKSYYEEVKKIDADKETYLRELQHRLMTHTYKTSPYEIFERTEGRKLRKIYKLPYFPDRICQWAIMQVIEKYLIRTMTADTYSAIPGRGTELVRKRMVEALRNDPEGTAWCLKIDVKKYYPSIDIDILKQKYRRIFKDKELIWLLDEILDSCPDSGVPIGNYISQYSGNIYLSDFDHVVKEQWGVKYYFRYMDDMVFLAASKEELQALIVKIKGYMRTELRLQIKDSWSLFRVDDRGIDFVGYVFTHEHIRLRKNIAKSLKRTSSKIRYRRNNGKMINRKLYFSINSLAGWLSHCHATWLRIKYVDTIWDWVEEFHDRVLAPKKEGGRRKCKSCLM